MAFRWKNIYIKFIINRQYNCVLENHKIYKTHTHTHTQLLGLKCCRIQGQYTKINYISKYNNDKLENEILKLYLWASLVAQWLRICLLMQGTRVRALVWEDPTCRGASGPVSHNCWACASGACAPQREGPRWWEARAPRWRAVHAPRWGVAPACRN